MNYPRRPVRDPFGTSSGVSQSDFIYLSPQEGEYNEDGIIDGANKTNSWMIQAGLYGYYSGDKNIDVQTDNVDKNEVLLNNMGKQCQVPE